jgi:hypothetical protein
VIAAGVSAYEMAVLFVAQDDEAGSPRRGPSAETNPEVKARVRRSARHEPEPDAQGREDLTVVIATRPTMPSPSMPGVKRGGMIVVAGQGPDGGADP